METSLTSYSLVKKLSVDKLHSLVVTNNGIPKNFIKYSISIYKIIYKTRYLQQQINASALLILPEGKNVSYPILSIQNGTNFIKGDAPTMTIHQQVVGFSFASHGYITLVPDYIGYGESSQYFHPYYDKSHSASCIVDLIVACKEFLLKESYQSNKKLFLAGYSEGGYVTLAAAQYLQQNPLPDLNLTAVSAGAGGFDLFEMLHSVTNIDNKGGQSAYIVFLILSYIEMNGWNKNLSYFFKAHFAQLIPQLFTGKYSGYYISSLLGNDLTKLFDVNFYNSLKNGGALDLKKALYQNSLVNWSPQFPLRLYHGTKDEVISFKNTEVTYSRLKQEKGNVELVAIPDATHSTAWIPMMASIIPWFKIFL